MAVIITVVILIVGGATGGILWATGVFGSSGDELLGTWIIDAEDEIEFKDNGDLVLDETLYYSSTWSVSEDTVTMTFVREIPTGDFECDNGDEIPGDYVNDGDEDCYNGEDEGVDVSSIPHITDTTVQEFRYEVVGNYLYLGLTSMTFTEDGSTSTNEISGAICADNANNFCTVMWRQTVSEPSDDYIEENSPSWFEVAHWGMSADQPESGTRNSFTAEDASASTTSGYDDVLISVRWQHAEDDLNWAFVVMKLTVGDNTYDCAPDDSQECSIGQDGDDNSLWETDEFLMLSESGSDICGGSGSCQIDIYVTYRGTSVAGPDSVVVA